MNTADNALKEVLGFLPRKARVEQREAEPKASIRDRYAQAAFAGLRRMQKVEHPEKWQIACYAYQQYDQQVAESGRASSLHWNVMGAPLA